MLENGKITVSEGGHRVPWTVFGGHLIDQNTREQFFEAIQDANVVRAALMPDAHLGYSLPIGGVVVADESLCVPAWVGYDIGCGVSTVVTSLREEELEPVARAWREAILDAVPRGFNIHKRCDRKDVDRFREAQRLTSKRADAEKAACSLGTLGGGNHFIQIGMLEPSDISRNPASEFAGHVCVTIHSGSRGFGHDVAEHFMKRAGGGKAREGRHAVAGRDAEEYDRCYGAAIAFAIENHTRMHRAVLKAFPGETPRPLGEYRTQHNVCEQRGGQRVYRKGAATVRAGSSELVPVAGNMHDGTFLAQALSDNTWDSCSHGAGRAMSRKAAKASLNAGRAGREMEGILCDPMGSCLDEARAAYKDPLGVLEAQGALVRVMARIAPRVNIQGGGK